jgi:hypothetical protein
MYDRPLHTLPEELLLAGAADLTPSLHPGRRHKDIRRRVEQIARANPFATAVASAREAGRRARPGDWQGPARKTRSWPGR